MSMFLLVPGVSGSVSDVGHQGWISLESIEWNACRSITSRTSTRRDRESAVARFGKLTCLKRADRASPALFIEACCGRGKEVQVHLTGTGDGSGADAFAEYVLSNAVISEYRVLATTQCTKLPIEKISIAFTRLELRYIPYDDDGRGMPPEVVAFDATRNATT